MLGELEEAKEARAASEAQVQQLHKQLLRLEENAEADLARAAEEVRPQHQFSLQIVTAHMTKSSASTVLLPHHALCCACTLPCFLPLVLVSACHFTHFPSDPLDVLNVCLSC